MKNSLSCAEAMDLMNVRIAVGLFLASVTYALDASVYWWSDPEDQVMTWVSFGFSLAAGLWIFRAVGPLLWKKIKSRSFTHQQHESFVAESFHQAILKSWVITTVALMVLKVSEKVLIKAALPIEFYLNGLIFLMLFSVSVVFLLMTHVNAEDDHDDDLHEGVV